MSKTYADYKAAFEERECTLLTTEEEFESIKYIKRKTFRIQYKCGHTCDKCWFDMFIFRGSNSKCKICTKIIMPEINTLDIEALSIKYISAIIEKIFDIIICVETCRCDIIIKPKDCTDNKWLPIQLKSTLKSSYNMYGFHLPTKYVDEILICIGLDDKRQWLFEEIPNVKRLSIGITSRNKYNEYELTNINLVTKLIECWNKRTIYKQEDINIPTTEYVDIEQKYVNIRKEHITCLRFERPERNQMVYDFKVNEKKVQEKTVESKQKKNAYVFKLMKNNGNKDKVRKYINYHIDDNDIYWLNLRNTYLFYVIPTNILYEKGYLQNDGKGDDRKKYLYIKPDSEEWYNAYKFNYKSIDEEKLIKLFS